MIDLVACHGLPERTNMAPGQEFCEHSEHVSKKQVLTSEKRFREIECFGDFLGTCVLLKSLEHYKSCGMGRIGLLMKNPNLLQVVGCYFWLRKSREKSKHLCI